MEGENIVPEKEVAAEGSAPEKIGRNAKTVSKRLAQQAALAEATLPFMLDDDDNPLAWQDRALCAQTDPEAFFPEKEEGKATTREAKKVCRSCDVRDECLDYALAHDERFGIWGGLSERERRKLKRRAA